MANKLPIAGIIFGIFLSGCTVLSPPQNTISSWTAHQQQLSRLKTWQANGVMSIKTPRESTTVYVHWQENPHSMQLRLLGPLGTPSAQLHSNGCEFILTTSEGKKYHASQPDALAAQIVGSPLPVAGLRYWILGIPARGRYHKTLSAQQTLSTLVQDGWQIDYLQYQTVGLYILPSELKLQRDTLTVKILIKEWQLPPASSNRSDEGGSQRTTRYSS